jgi:copper chaperone CopZ
MALAKSGEISYPCQETSALLRTHMLGQMTDPREQKEHLSDVPPDLSDALIAAMQVEGLDCAHCADRVRYALTAIEGVVSAAVDWERGLAIVDYVPSQTTVDALIDAIGRAGGDGKHAFRGVVL